MEGGLGPDADQLRSLHDDADRAERVVMLNLLHFREHARYAPRDDAPAERTGRQAYGRYGRIAAPLIGREGGRLRWMARRMRALSDGPVTSWDQVAVVQYPSRSAFLRMIASARYRDATPHRNAALDRTRLLVCTSHAEFY
jgi:uncharacterized protein (DUF1330 family)